MNIDIKDLLTLSDKNKYVVVSKIYYDGKDYLYLIDINNSANLKFCYIENDSIIEITDKELNTKLLPLFLEKAKDVAFNVQN